MKDTGQGEAEVRRDPQHILTPLRAAAVDLIAAHDVQPGPGHPLDREEHDAGGRAGTPGHRACAGPGDPRPDQPQAGGTQAAANTCNRKRMVINNAMEYAAEVGALPSNPLGSVKWTRPRKLTTVSTWLNATGDPAQVAEWAGHSVDVLRTLRQAHLRPGRASQAPHPTNDQDRHASRR